MAKLIDKLKSDQEKDIYRKLGHYCAYQERAESEVLNKLESLEVSETLSIKLIELLKKDKFLNNKYKVKINQKVLDRITNSF